MLVDAKEKKIEELKTQLRNTLEDKSTSPDALFQLLNSCFQKMNSGQMPLRIKFLRLLQNFDLLGLELKKAVTQADKQAHPSSSKETPNSNKQSEQLVGTGVGRG
mmetsp:Transcript_11814/g.19968  ORF Transcript_11814/g.19968 Transcript_11814/m.19968 type:complete len:105 (+) Transcript_11814:509-823(+)